MFPRSASRPESTDGVSTRTAGPAPPGKPAAPLDRRARALRLAARAALGCLALATLGCGTDEADRIQPQYSTPLRTDAELQTALRDTCEARAGDAPLLVEFSAAWCSDCQKLGGMKRALALATELAAWPHLTVNVGRFDHHRPILDAMGIKSIAHWAVLDPESCLSPITQWTRIADRTLEVSSGSARNLTPDDLAQWLRAFRAG